jgi:hypothetical protein
VEGARQLGAAEGQHEGAHGHAPVEVVQHQRASASECGRERRIERRLALVARAVLGAEAVGGEHGVDALFDDPDRGAGDADE